MPLSLPDPIEYAVKRFRNDGQNERYALYRDYLDGNHPLQFASPKYESAFGNLFEAFAYDRTNMVVDAHADRLRIVGFDGRAAAKVQAIWDANSMKRREGEIEAEALGEGDAYIIVEKHPETGKVNIWANDAENVRVYYSDEDPGKIEFAVKAWRIETGYMRINVYLPGRVEKYISGQKAHSGMPMSAKNFERYELDGEPWPMPTGIDDMVPVFHVPNNARTGRYGVSELRHVIPIQNALNKTLTDLMVAMEMGAYPQKVILGVQPPPYGTDEDAASQAKLNRFELGIDRILEIIGDNARIAEFQAVALAQFIATAQFFDTAVSRVTRVPVHWLSMSGDFPSGQALRTAESPFVGKIEDRQDAFGEVFGNAMQYALRLDGVADPGEITPIWKSAAPLSMEDELELAMMKQTLGLPMEWVLKGLSFVDETDIPNIVELADRKAAEAIRAFDRGAIPPGIDDDAEAAD